jgi:hypothetical protein
VGTSPTTWWESTGNFEGASLMRAMGREVWKKEGLLRGVWAFSFTHPDLLPVVPLRALILLPPQSLFPDISWFPPLGCLLTPLPPGSSLSSCSTHPVTLTSDEAGLGQSTHQELEEGRQATLWPALCGHCISIPCNVILTLSLPQSKGLCGPIYISSFPGRVLLFGPS